MANDNDFSFGNLGKDYDDRKVNSDYLDLLSETKVNEAEIRRETDSRDIYSSSERTVNNRSFVNNIYADDEPEDVFTLSDEPPQYEDVYSNSDIYLSKKRAVKIEKREEEYEDIPIAPRPRKTQASPKSVTMDLDDDEISDYEVRRGKQVTPKKKKKRKSPKILMVLAVFLAVVIAFSGV